MRSEDVVPSTKSFTFSHHSATDEVDSCKFLLVEGDVGSNKIETQVRGFRCVFI